MAKTQQDGQAPFAGFPEAALDFYDDLEVDNTKSFWEAHRATYDECVRAPMLALTAELAPEFGTAKVYRPYRDVRFAKDKTPYKNHQGAFVAAGPACGWYVQIGPPGVRISGGFYWAERENLARIRTSIVEEHSGQELERLLAILRGKGFEIGGEQLKTAPRGYDRDHPRIDLLRHKALTASKDYGFGELIRSRDLLGEIRADWRKLRPLVDWINDRLDQLG